MAQPPPTRQNRLKVISLFIFCILVILAIQLMMPRKAQPPSTLPPTAVASQASTPGAIAVNLDHAQTAPPADDADLYIGIRKPTPQEVYQAIPEAQGKPLVIMFHSQYCLDCKKMSPMFDRLMPHYPGILYHVYDIMKDTKTSPAVFNTFKPVTVPVMIFITPTGTIENVFYNEQSEKTITTALDHLKSARFKSSQ